MIQVPTEEPPKNLEFKIAETQEELAQAYQILHNSYVENKFQTPHPSGMRIIKYFALTTTTTLIAKWDGVVIGTMSVIRKGPFGLPIESVFDISGIEAGGKTVAEVSSLAIASEYRHRRGTLFLPLCKFFYLYVRDCLHIDRAVVAVNPSWSDFYEGYLDFTLLEKRVISNCQFANGAPAVGLWSDVTTWENRFLKMYGDRAPNLNFHHYLTQEITDCLKFPERDFEKAMDPVMTPEMLSYFFYEKSSVFDQLSPQDVLALHSCYPQKLYALVLPKLTELNLRKTARYTVHALGETEIGSPMRLLDVSETGVRMQGPLPRRTKFNFIVNISPNQIARLSGIVQWIDQSTNSYGVEVLGHDEAWAAYLKHLRGDFEIKKPKIS